MHEAEELIKNNNFALIINAFQLGFPIYTHLISIWFVLPSLFSTLKCPPFFWFGSQFVILSADLGKFESLFVLRTVIFVFSEFWLMIHLLNSVSFYLFIFIYIYIYVYIYLDS